MIQSSWRVHNGTGVYVSVFVFACILWFGMVSTVTITDRIKTSLNHELDPNHYFTYIPLAGLNNQFLNVMRAMSISRHLNRTLILPPIIYSPHDPTTQPVLWSKFFDFEEFTKKINLKMIDYNQILTNLNESTEFPCISTFDSKFHKHSYTTTSHFLGHFSLQLELSSFPGRSPLTVPRFYLGLDKLKQNPLICVTDAFSVRKPDTWKNIGAHLHYNNNFHNFAKAHIARTLGIAINDTKYFAIHLRRADFKSYCDRLQSSDTEYQSCLPSIATVEKTINEFKSANPETKDYPIFIVTNENNGHELDRMKNLGWILNNKVETDKVLDEYGHFGIAMVDGVALVDADVAFGSKYSTFFGVAALRRESWYGKEKYYFI